VDAPDEGIDVGANRGERAIGPDLEARRRDLVS
jgi:hypothetical protein